MAFCLTWVRRNLQFKFKAKTSRGALQHHTAYYLKLFNAANPEVSGIGEAAPLAGLSIDATPDFEAHLTRITEHFNGYSFTNLTDAEKWIDTLELLQLPSLKFGLETALLDYKRGGNKVLFDTNFTKGKAGIPINGLIWMGDKAFMKEQISKKLEEGFSCLKLKIGGLDFETECAILNAIRDIASPENLIIRLDANGAFDSKQAMQKLDRLANFKIHSIEQPIKPGQLPEMRELCKNSPIPIALDEELIGVTKLEKQTELLEIVRPSYLIFKPTLLGGLTETNNWIALAEKNIIQWWITSALESNIGLNAIAQFSATHPVVIPQGLGTGQLYYNNIDSPLEVKNGYLYYNSNSRWASPDS